MKTSVWLVLSVFCLLNLAPVAWAQEEARKVTLMPHWKKGEKRQYTMVKGRRKTQGSAAVSGKSTTLVRIEVLDANDAGYLLGWTAGETRIEDPAQAADPFTQALVDLARDVTIVLQLGSDTKLRGVRNWQQLQTLAHKVVEMSVQALQKKGANDAALDKTRRQLLSMFATRQQIEVLFTRSPQVFFAPLGMEYVVGRPREYEDQLPNPLGGESFPTRASFTLEKVDPVADTAIVTWRQEIDPVAGAGVLEKTLRDLAARLGKPVPPGKVLDLINVKDEARFTVDLSSGWPRQLSHTRTTSLAGASQEDTLAFSEVKP
ncbi:MAG: hypothetical protein MUC88_20275 [Planctomycetes bacterium]|nr:hypothetical protein [Planctomycetota bacterium]